MLIARYSKDSGNKHERYYIDPCNEGVLDSLLILDKDQCVSFKINQDFLVSYRMITARFFKVLARNMKGSQRIHI